MRLLCICPENMLIQKMTQCVCLSGSFLKKMHLACWWCFIFCALYAVLSAVVGIKAASSSLNSSKPIPWFHLAFDSSCTWLHVWMWSNLRDHVWHLGNYCVGDSNLICLISASADVVTVLSLAILVFLFSLQRFGTARVSFLFAPIFSVWFLVLAMLGCYNIIKWDKSVFQAFSPLQIVYFFRRNGRTGWEHLGGIVLCMTGTNMIYRYFTFIQIHHRAWPNSIASQNFQCMLASDHVIAPNPVGTEALFADLGHFSYRSIQVKTKKVKILETSIIHLCLEMYWQRTVDSGQVAFTALVYPCLILTYIGQAAYLMGHMSDVSDPFYSSLPRMSSLSLPMSKLIFALLINFRICMARVCLYRVCCMKWIEPWGTGSVLTCAH